MQPTNEIFPCEYCDGSATKRVMRVPFHFRGQTIYVDRVPVWACGKCGEKYFDAPVYKNLEEIARHRRLLQQTISFPLARYSAPIA
jgi:YgiT-type zinc finger domain-containing protein